MPELPEIGTTHRGITPYLEGQHVERVIMRERRLRWPVPEDLDVRSSGQRIVSVEHRAKYLLPGAEASTLISRLGISGSLRLVEGGIPASRHEHVDIELASGMALRCTDPRRFGTILWNLAPLGHELLHNLGPGPLTDALADQCPSELSHGRSMAVKPFIMDNAVVIGVDNIYANEALFAAGIDPHKPAGSIPKTCYLRPTEKTKWILAIATERSGTTLRDFVGGDGQSDCLQQELFAYGRGGEFCKVCGGILREIRLGQRASVYCSRCQR